MAAATVSIGLEALLARQALVLSRHLLGDAVEHAEYLCEEDAPVDAGKEMRRNLRMASLPARPGPPHRVPFEGEEVVVRVEDLAPARATDREALAVTLCCRSGGAGVDRFLDAARRHCEEAATAPRAGDTTRRYLFDSGYWERLSDAPRRPPGSVFLSADARALSADVLRFMTDPDVRERHRRYGVPYKLNVLLHGPPGTGKTSLIDSIAGELGSDVFLVQFTARLRDTDLAVALKRVADHPNPVVVMEDVDCMFSERKRHDSSKNAVTLGGLLNSLDGMYRPEGSVVFLTTNDPSCLDAAVTRSRRIDRTLHMSHADAGQTADMLRAFFPALGSGEAGAFCRGASALTYTTADLHQFLFGLSPDAAPCHRAFARALADAGGLAAKGPPPMYS